jgi:cell division septum initiation protein DivIVA
VTNKLGQLVIELAANTARLQSDLGKAVGMAERAAAGMKKAFAVVGGGGLISAALIGAAKQSIALGDDLQKAAIKAGVSGKAISELAYVAKQADIDLGSLSTGLKKMQVALSEANSGGKAQVETLAALGLKIRDVINLKPDEQFELLADRISQLKDPADRARAATELFGKAGADLLPLFAEGAEGIAKARAEAEKLGVSFGDEQIKKLADADTAIKQLNASWQGFVTTLTAAVAPSLTTALKFWSGAPRDIYEQVADLEDKISSLTSARGAGSGSADKAKRLAELQAQLSALREQAKQASMREMGVGEKPTAATGFGSEAAAAAMAKRYAEDTADVIVKSAKVSSDAVANLYDQWSDSALSTYDKEIAAFNERVAKLDALRDAGRISGEQYARAFVEAQDDVLGEVEVKVKKVAVKTGTELSSTAAMFKDTFLNAFDDLINTGKFKFDQFLKYLVAEWSRKWIATAFDNAFSTSSSGSSSGGLLSAIGSAIGSLFGGSGTEIDGKASGGPVRAGQTYLVGEHGRELFTAPSNGTIVPNHALGGGSTVSIVNNVSLTGASTVTQEVLERALTESNRRTFDELDRRGVMRTAA